MKIDFATMRENCIQTHQVVSDLFRVFDHVGVHPDIKVKSADELRTHEETKSWDGMGRYSKELHDNDAIWNELPKELWIRTHDGERILWKKKKAKKLLLDSYWSLGGKNLYA